MVFKIGLTKQLEGNQTIRIFLNIEDEDLETAIRRGLEIAKQLDAKLEFVDQLVEGYIDVPMEELLKKIVNSESKPKGGIYG